MSRPMIFWRLVAALGLAFVGCVALSPGPAFAVPTIGAAYQDDADDDADDDGGDDDGGLAALGGAPYPANVSAGTCRDLGDVAFPLADVDRRGGVGAETGEASDPDGPIAAIVSRAEIDASLDDVLAAPHAISVSASANRPAAGVACGNLGGEVIDGALIVGLRPLGGSGLAGIAVLEDEDDDGQTDVTVYLAAVGGGDVGRDDDDGREDGDAGNDEAEGGEDDGDDGDDADDSTAPGAAAPPPSTAPTGEDDDADDGAGGDDDGDAGDDDGDDG